MEPGALDQPIHAVDRVDKGAQWISFEPANAVFYDDCRVDVPHVTRIRIGERTLRMSKRFVQQRFKCRVAADNAIECDHRCGRNLRPDVNKVAVHEVDSSKSVAARRFL